MRLNERGIGADTLAQLILSSIQTGEIADDLWKLSPKSQDPRYSLAWGRFSAEPVVW